MGLMSRRRGRRPRVIALVCSGMLVAIAFSPGSSALARSGSAAPGAAAGPGKHPSPLAHAPPFRRAFGQQTLASPGGVAADPAGDIWIADTGHDRIAEYSPTGRLLATFGKNLDQPAGIATDATGHIWVADTGHDQVVEFSPVGRVLAIFGSPGRGRGQLNQPVALTVTPFGDVWVADQGNSRVEQFSASGRYRTSFALPTPAGVGLDVRGDVWVTSPAYAPGNSVREFAPDGHELRSFGTTQAGYGDLGDPGGIAVGPGGRIYVAQPDYGLVSVFSPAGGFYTEFGLQPGTAQADENLEFPQGLAVTAAGQVWVADSGHNRVVQFGRVPGIPATGTPTAPGGPSRPLIIAERLLALVIAGLGWYLARRRQPDPPADTPSRASASWTSQHEAWNNGKMDQWVQAKGPFTMGYYTQADIPFQWALAQAFTVCDNYHCSVLGPTNPNRLYMWTGMIDPGGSGGGPVTDDSPAYNNVTLSWTTYPERLQQAGVSWQVYQEEDNYDDNALAWFKQFSQAPVASPLWQRGMRKRPAGAFETDARQGRLPQVSWLVAPTAQSEHPDYFPAAGAGYVASKLDAIASNQDLWHKTLFILTYDENDGLFDHVPPPVAPRQTPGEYVSGEPIGLGFRVPAVVVSPWSAGGRVCSGVLDHTSLIRVIEKRFGVREPNISAFRRRVCGDFTSALRFSVPPAGYPRSPEAVTLAAAEAGLLTAQQEVYTRPAPLVPVINEPVPSQ